MSVGNTSKDGTGTMYWLLVNSDGRLEISGAAAHDAAASGNPVRVGGVYRSAAPSVSDGDVVDLLVDAAGRLQTSATSSQVDDAAFTVATSSITVIGGLGDETAPDSVNEGDAGAVRMSLDRMLLVQASGRAAEDAAAAGNPLLMGGRYDTTARTLDNGDAGAVAIDDAGAVLVVGAALENAAVDGAPVQVGGRYDAAARTLNDGDAGGLAVDVAGRAIVAGAAAEDGAVAGNPVLIAGRYDSANRDLDNGDVGTLAVDADSRLYVNTAWTPSLQAEENANDSDKSFTVSASTEWEIKWIWVELTTTATAGNRSLRIEIQDSAADVICHVDAGAVQAASLTRYYTFAPWNSDLTSFRGPSSDHLMTPIPPGMILPASYVVRIYDSAAVDAAADDMIVQMMVQTRTV